MAECGSGASMSAAALAFLAGGTLEQSLAAASMALQGSLGMICDPIGNRVEAPCLGKNVLAATNANQTFDQNGSLTVDEQATLLINEYMALKRSGVF